MSLFRRFILTTTGMFFIVIGLFAFLGHAVMAGYVNDAKTQRIELLAEIVTNGLKSIMLEGKTKEEFQKFLDTLAAEDINSVKIFSDSGIILNSTVPGEVGKRVDDRHISFSAVQEKSAFFVHEHEGTKVYSNIIVMSNDWPCQRCHGASDEIRAIVDLELVKEKIDASAKGSIVWTFLIYLATAGLFSAATAVLVRVQIKNPMDGVIRQVQRISGGELHARISGTEAAELSAIASGVNVMADEIEKARKEIKQLASRETGHLEKMASIGELAATVAHEIKNPLAGISGALQVMAEDIPEENPRKEICNEILSEIERLDRAVKDLIAFARPQEINAVVADLNAIAAEAVSRIRPLADAAGIQVTLLAGTLPEVKVDPEQFGQVLKNILLFQMQLMPDGGALSVSTAFLDDTEEIEVLSADTAAALSSERIRNIFRPSFSTKHGGTGLGLAVSRNIMESHGGRITVESEFGSGNSFRIIIPGNKR